MQTKTRILLPFIQVALAAALTASNLLRPDSLADPAFRKWDMQLCSALNAPATVVAHYPCEIAYQWISPYYRIGLAIELVLRFSLIWFVWYVVSIEIGGRGVSVLATKSRMRNVADILAIVFGGIVGLAGLLNGSTYVGGYAMLLAVPYLAWAAAIVAFYGHDLWVSRQHAMSGA